MNTIKKIVIILLLLPVSTVVVSNICIIAIAQVNVDADSDGLTDKQEDINSNKIVEDTETDPNNPDTDGDGTNDGEEKKVGTNPLDFNSSPQTFPVEIDADNNGVPDKDFTDAELLTNFNLVKINTTDLANGAKCNEITITLDNSVFDCNYPLKPITKKYTFGADDFKIKLETSSLESRCSIEDNGKPTAYISCKNINFNDASKGDNSVNLFAIKFNQDVVYYNDNLKVEVLLDPYLANTNELTAEQDLTLERNCIPVESYETTSCTFKLPKDTILPPEYLMGLMTDPGGECVQKLNTIIVECTNVPTGESKGITEVRTTLNNSVNYKALVASKSQTGHIETEQEVIPTLKFITNTELKSIENVKTGYNGGVELKIYNSKGDAIKTVLGQITSDQVFIPDDLTILDSKTLPVGSYNAVFTSLDVTPNSLKLDYQIVIQILDNTPSSIEIIKKSALTRTGGQSYITLLSFSFISFWIVIALILNRKKFRKTKAQIVIVILFTIILSSLGVTESLIISQAQNVQIKTLTAFSNYSCNPQTVEVGQRVNCTMDLTNPTLLPLNQTILTYVDTSPTTQSFSKPCRPFAGIKWVCQDQYVNSVFQNGNLTNKLTINLGAISYYNRGETKLTLSHQALAIATLNTTQVANFGTVSTFVNELNTITTSGNTNSNIEIRYASANSLPVSQSVYFTIRDKYTNNILYNNINATRNNSYNFTAKVPTYGPEQWLIEACVGSATFNCKIVQKKTEFTVTPNLKALPVFTETNLNADKINLVFSCDTTFKSTTDCKTSITSMMSWDGQPRPSDWSGKTTANNRANTVEYGTFAIEPYKSNRDKFNILYVDNLVDNFNKILLLDNIKDSGVDNKSTIIIRLHNISARSFAYFPDYGPKANLTKADMNFQTNLNRENYGVVEQYIGVNGNDTLQSGKVIAHELGHALFGLKDEYSEPKSLITSYSYPNCQQTQSSAISDWTAITGLNQAQLDGKVDQAYYDWVNEQKKYSYYSTNLASGNFQVGRRESDFKTSYTVKGGCFGPENGPAIKPTPFSLMSNNSPVMGTVNRARAQSILNLFGGTVKPCTNTATNPPACNKFPPCTNNATNPPSCNNQVIVNPPKLCTNSATNPPKCDKVPPCTNGALNKPLCNKFPPCSNRATNPPACDNLANDLVAFCPSGASFDTSIGFCASATEVFGPFPRSIVDRCVRQFPQDKSCTSTKLVSQNGINFSLNVYPKARFLTFRGTGVCPFGTSLSTVVKGGYCYESDTQDPTDYNSKANVFGPFTNKVYDSCVARKGGNACSLNRISYSFFKQLAQ